MPVVFRSDGIRFFFFSNEGNPRELVHVHAQRGASLAKLWLRPEVTLAANHGFSAGELRLILAEVNAHVDEIERVWHEYFG